MKLAFDIETDGLIPELTKIHCIVARDIETDEEFRFDGLGEHPSIKEGLDLLAGADELWGHNIVNYDIPAIQKLRAEWTPQGTIRDTLILSRLFFTDLLDRDFRSRPALMPGNLYGRHSLEAWGHRLGHHKSEFGKSLEGDWSTYSPEMLEYCARDVEVSVALAKTFVPKVPEYIGPVETEHEIARLMSWQEQAGYPFDVRAAQALESKLRLELDTLSDDMRETFHFVDGGVMTPKRSNKVRHYFENAPFCKLREFNPTSRHHIAWAFEHHRGWEPKERTAGGQPKIDDEILRELNTKESLAFARILELQKHLGQLSEGKNAWLKLERKGRVHHSCVLNTNTGRMAHMRPNLAQVPSAHEYRSLFTPGDNRVQVGADASGLELRCLGHYLSRYDGGKFAEEVVNGDIHTALAEIYGTTRKAGKGVTYCLIYGGGNNKLGLTAGASKQSASRKGQEIRGKIMSGLAGFAELNAAIQERAKSGVLKGLDGRPIRLQGKNHAALNYLLQSAGAIICKLWVIRAHELLQEAGIDYYPLAFVHDEMQLSVAPEQAEMASTLITLAMKDVEHQVNFRCALDSEAQTGNTWADCH